MYTIIQSTDKMSSALHEAATMNELSCVKYLLSVGADVNLTNSLGEMPFDCSHMLDIQMYVCMYVCTYVRTYVYVRMYVCMYITQAFGLW